MRVTHRVHQFSAQAQIAEIPQKSLDQSDCEPDGHIDGVNLTARQHRVPGKPACEKLQNNINAVPGRPVAASAIAYLNTACRHFI
jgi:hypothetical protein